MASNSDKSRKRRASHNDSLTEESRQPSPLNFGTKHPKTLVISKGFQMEEPPSTNGPQLGENAHDNNNCQLTIMYDSSIDFTKKWERSDMAIKTAASIWLLYVNMEDLASYSAYFSSLFAEARQSEQKIVKVDVDYNLMLKILRILHHNDTMYSSELGIIGYPPTLLEKLYRAGELFEIPVIKEMVRQQLSQIQTLAGFKLALQLGFHKEKSEILKKLTLGTIEKYLKKTNSKEESIFTTSDMAEMIEKCRESEKAKECQISPFPLQNDFMSQLYLADIPVHPISLRAEVRPILLETLEDYS